MGWAERPGVLPRIGYGTIKGGYWQQSHAPLTVPLLRLPARMAAPGHRVSDLPLLPFSRMCDSLSRVGLGGLCPTATNQSRSLTSSTPSQPATPANLNTSRVGTFDEQHWRFSISGINLLAQPIKPLLTGMPEAVTRDRGRHPKGPGGSTQDRKGTSRDPTGRSPRSPADREHRKDLRRGSR